MKAIQKVITATLLTTSLAAIAIVAGGGISHTAHAAISYQDTVTLGYEFSSTLSLSLTNDEIAISALTPGSMAVNDEPISVTVSTNNVSGYILYASVGSSSQAYTSLKTTGGAALAMIGSTGALNSDTSTSAWGYAVGSSVTTASNFSPIAIYSEETETTVINQTSDPEGTAATGYTGGNTTVFNIGAYAPTGQTAGTYSNIINFTAVTNVVEED